MSVLLISPGGTTGWRINEAALAASLERLGVEHEVRRVSLGGREGFRHPWATGSLIVAEAARRELKRALRDRRPDAVIAVNPTAAMRFPFGLLRRARIPVAIRIDCPASAQFPGPAHAIHRRFERRGLARAELALTMGQRSAQSVRGMVRRAVHVPIPVEASERRREPVSPPFAVAYAPQPKFKGLDRIIEAWGRLGERRGDALLVVAGLGAEAASRYVRRKKLQVPRSVRWAPEMEHRVYLDMVSAATAFVSASRIEGYGLAQMEALAAGIPLVTTSSRGAYEAEEIARSLAPELVSEPDSPELAAAIATALEMPPARRALYRERSTASMPTVAESDRALRGALILLGLDVPGRAAERTWL